MAFTNPGNRYTVEINTGRGWVAYLPYPTLERAERAALLYMAHDIPVRILDMQTGKIVWAG